MISSYEGGPGSVEFVRPEPFNVHRVTITVNDQQDAQRVFKTMQAVNAFIDETRQRYDDEAARRQLNGNPQPWINIHYYIETIHSDVQEGTF